VGNLLLREREKDDEEVRGGLERGREGAQLEELTTKGTSGARKIRRAHILLLANEGLIDKEIARAMNAAVTTVERVRKRFVEEGVQSALSERSRPAGEAQT
jgi:FixJ family two-component response regulator